MTAVPPALPGTAQNKRLKESHEFTRLLLGGLQLDNRCEDATLEALSGEPGKPTVDRVGPGARRRGEVEGDAGMACEPAAHLGVLVGSIVVEDHMDGLVGRHVARDGIEKADKFLVPVALHAAADDLAFEISRAANRVVVPWRL